MVEDDDIYAIKFVFNVFLKANGFISSLTLSTVHV